VNAIIEKVNLPNADALKKLSFELRNEVKDLFMVLAADINGKPQIAIMISENLVSKNDLHAGTLIRELAREIKGGGGGQPFFATAGGKDLNGLDAVIEKTRQMVPELLKS
jgi:alanyl-tRNA synthetase